MRSLIKSPVNIFIDKIKHLYSVNLDSIFFKDTKERADIISKGINHSLKLMRQEGKRKLGALFQTITAKSNRHIRFERDIPKDDIRTFAAINGIIARAAQEDIIPLATMNFVVSATCMDKIEARATINTVIILATVH